MLRKIKNEYWKLSVEYKKIDIKVAKLVHDIKLSELNAWRNKGKILTNEMADLLKHIVKTAVLETKIEEKEAMIRHQEKMNEMADKTLKKAEEAIKDSKDLH